LLDLADNWLKLVRVELDVFSDNQKAISLYQSCGFEIEGKKVCCNSKWEALRFVAYGALSLL
jgi:putative acetyltransferase